jgi:hypothetical protein
VTQRDSREDRGESERETLSDEALRLTFFADEGRSARPEREPAIAAAVLLLLAWRGDGPPVSTAARTQAGRGKAHL